MPTAMVVSPHADDAAVFCGATLAKFAAEGWKTVLVRVTDDAKDSVGLSEAVTKRVNAEELHHAARILGIAEVVELGYETDSLADASLVELRGRIVHEIRKHQPYAVFTFDPFGIYEGNMDHVRVAQATEEAFWVACFDLHHTEHFAEGLEPFAVCERWYFGRHLPRTNWAVDVTDHFERKIEAICAHGTMMRNVLNQYRLQLKTWGRQMPELDAAMADDLRPVVEGFFTGQARACTAKHGLPEGRLVEEFRLDRFGDMEVLFQASSEPIPGAEQGPRRQGLDP